MATITKRATKGSPLTNDEVDANFENLNTDKLETSGGSVTGDISFGDNDKAIFGAGSDLQIYHDGSNSIIEDVGTGELFISGASSVGILNGDRSEYMINAVQNGAVTAYHNGSAKLATTATGIDVTGTVTADGLTVDSSSSVISTFNGTAATGVNVSLKNTEHEFYIGTNDGNLYLYDVDNTASRFNIASNGDISFYEDTGTTAKFFWDASAESLGIGTTTVRGDLNILTSASNFSTDQDGDYGSLFVQGGNANTEDSLHGAISFGKAISGVGRESYKYGAIALVQTTADVDQNGLAFYVSPNADQTSPGTISEAMRITSGGNVGIGENDPKTILHTYGTSSTTYDPLAVGGQNTSATLRIQNASTAANTFSSIDFNTNNNRVVNRIVSSHGSTTTDGFLAFITEGSGVTAEAMRLDSIGNLLVGGTDTFPGNGDTNTGASITAGGNAAFSCTSNRTLFNRNSTDGDIVEFRKDGTAVGSIGVNTTRPFIASTAMGVKIAGTEIHPTNSSGTSTDATYNLGSSSFRWEDLYLSGGVYLGGTGAANHLDDYEEGTFTPTYILVGTDFDSVTYNIQNGYYRKIGGIVHISLSIRTTAITVGSGSGSGAIGNLPFTSSQNSGSSCKPGRFNGWSETPGGVRVANGENFARLVDEGTTSDLTSAAFLTGSNQNFIDFQFFYFA